MNFEIQEQDSQMIGDDMLDYIAEHNSDPMDFLYAIMHEAKLSDSSALGYLVESFGYKYTEDELKEIIRKYREEVGDK